MDEIIIDDEEIISYYDENIYKSYINEIKKYKILSNEEILNLYNSGCYQKIIESNLRLVVWVAKKYINRVNHMEFLDLIQEGNIGLMNAIKHFDPSKGAFTTCAVLWIEQAIGISIKNKEDIIRKPAYIKDVYNNYLKLIKEDNLSKEEIMNKLDISEDIYNSLLNMDKFNTKSLNSKIGDEDDTELVDFVSDKKNDFANDVVIIKDQEDVLSIIKYSLKPIEYYILYYRYIGDEELTYDDISKKINITRQAVCNYIQRVLLKLKRINYNNPRIYNMLLDRVNNYVGNHEYNLYPIKPDNIILYMFLSKVLSPIELDIYYNEFISDIKYSNNEIARKHRITIKEFNKVYDRLKDKIVIISNKDTYINYYNQMIKIYKSSIYNYVDNNPKNIIDPTYLRNKYFGLSYYELQKLFRDNNVVLSRKNLKVLNRFYSFNYYNGSSLHEIERDINILKLGYYNRYSFLPINVLYDTYINNIDEFSDYHKDLLDKYVFKTRDSNVSYMKDRIIYIIDKIERLYYGINNIPDFSKDKYLLVKEKYKDKFNDERTQIMDLYYGVNHDKLSVSDIAIKLNKSRDDVRDLLRKGIISSRNLFIDNTNTLTIDKNIYIPYLNNNCCELLPNTYEIMKCYLIDNLSSDEISSMFNISKYQLSNTITEAIKKIDYYRFGIIKKQVIDEDTYNNVIKDSGLTEVELNVIKDRFFSDLDNKEITKKYNLSNRKTTDIISKFNLLYENYQIKDVVMKDEDYINEYNKHISETLLTIREKEFLKLFFIDKKDIPYIANTFNISVNVCYQLKYRVVDKIKQSKIGIKPDLYYISRDELNILLQDKHLPVSDKERDIICYLFELNDHPYKTLSELSKIYNENDTSLRRRYYRSIVSIYKYKNNEINGFINYEEDVYPNLKYFGLYNRNIIIDMYKNNLTADEISIKYNLSINTVRVLIRNIKYKMYCLINDIDVKKFDFDYYLSINNYNELPFYSNINLAKKIFDLYYGMNEAPISLAAIKEGLNLDYNLAGLSHLLSNFVLSIYKYRDGIKRIKSFSFDEVLNYYNKYKDNMSIQHQLYYDRYINKRTNKVLNTYTNNINREILFDLIKDSTDYIPLSSLTKDDIIDILNTYDKELSKDIKNKLKLLYDIDSINNKEINKFYKILNQLDIKLLKEEVNQKEKTLKL